MPASMSTGIVLFLVWLFAVAAVHKLRNPVYYRGLVSAYIPVAPGLLVGALAALEFCLALALLLPRLRAVGLAVGAGLLAVYAAMMAWQYLSGHRDLRCGCSGPASELTVGPALVVRNLLCGILALLALAGGAPAPMSIAVIGLSLLVGVFMIFIYLCSDQVIANAQAMAEEV